MVRWVIWGVLIIVGAILYLISQGESGDVGGPSSGSSADSIAERDRERGTVSRVYETVEGNPSVTWTETPNLVDDTLTLVGTVDSVVRTNDLSVILYYKSPDSQENWCGVVGKPWLSIVEPPPPNTSYTSSNTSMWCEITYGTEDNRVSGKEQFRDTQKPRTIEVTFPFKTAEVWTINGKTFRIRTSQQGLDRPGTHAFTLWAGPELLAVHVVDRSNGS